VKKWNETYAYPKLVIASASTIANAFETRFGKVIPEVRGDLTEYWTDGLGTDARRVGYNRPAKETLVQAEILSTMLGQPLPAADSYAAWRWIQLGTEHTWGYMMPDQPIAKTIEATKASYFEKARDTSRAVLAKTIAPIAKPDSQTITVFNTLAWPRTGVVTLPKGVVALKGMPVQKLSTGETVFLAKVPALGAMNYQTDQTDQTDRTDRTEVKATPTTLENALVKVTLDPQTGDIASLVDKKTGHEFVDAESPYRLNSYRYLRGGDAPAKATGPTEVKITIKENGPVLASLLVESKAEGCNQLTREIRIIAGQPQIEIVNVVDKIATRAKEGIHFAFAFNLPKDATARMDIPWGVMNPVTDQIDGANKNWLACQRWIDVSGADCGVTWVPIEASIVQFGDITANLLGSVARSSWKKEIGDTRTIVSWALNNHWHTNFPLEQGGIIPFHYAILPHGAYDPVVANRFGLEQNQPLIAVPTEKREETKAVVALDNPRIFISTLKASDDGKATILRLRSLSSKPETVKLSFPAGKPKSIELSDAMESAGKKAGSNVSLLPYGTATLILRMK
jgi:alpha-mannosidase